MEENTSATSSLREVLTLAKTAAFEGEVKSSTIAAITNSVVSHIVFPDPATRELYCRAMEMWYPDITALSINDDLGYGVVLIIPR